MWKDRYNIVCLQLNEKDMSMLEERIKRSGKFVEGGAARAPEPTNQIHAPNATKSIKETKSVPSNMAKTPANIEKLVYQQCRSES